MSDETSQGVLDKVHTTPLPPDIQAAVDRIHSIIDTPLLLAIQEELETEIRSAKLASRFSSDPRALDNWPNQQAAESLKHNGAMFEARTGFEANEIGRKKAELYFELIEACKQISSGVGALAIVRLHLAESCDEMQNSLVGQILAEVVKR